MLFCFPVQNFAYIGQLTAAGLLSKKSIFNIAAVHHLAFNGGSMLESTRKPWERCRTEGTRDEAHGRVQLHIDLTCVRRA